MLKDATTTSQMNAILYPCIRVLLSKNNTTLADLKRFMNDGQNQELVQAGLNIDNPIIRDFFQNKFQEKALNVSKHAIEMRLQSLLNDPLFQRLLLWSSSIDLEQLIEQKKIIIFRLPLGEAWSETVQIYWRFIVALLKVIALKRSKISTYQRTPTYLFIDEFHNFVSPDFEKALTQLRKYRLYLVLASQYIGQCADRYLQKALLSVGVIITGNNERTSRKAVESETWILSNAIEDLKNWEFFVKSYLALPFKIRVPKLLLNNSNSMSLLDWKSLCKQQISKYYFKSVFSFEPNKFRGAISLKGLTPKYAN